MENQRMRAAIEDALTADQPLIYAAGHDHNLQVIEGDDDLVADVVRIDKGHTEGLEPAVTEALVKLMVSARGGRMQSGGL